VRKIISAIFKALELIIGLLLYDIVKHIIEILPENMLTWSVKDYIGIIGFSIISIVFFAIALSEDKEL
jgi:hypothetical protein